MMHPAELVASMCTKCIILDPLIKDVSPLAHIDASASADASCVFRGLIPETSEADTCTGQPVLVSATHISTGQWICESAAIRVWQLSCYVGERAQWVPFLGLPTLTTHSLHCGRWWSRLPTGATSSSILHHGYRSAPAQSIPAVPAGILWAGGTSIPSSIELLGMDVH